MALVIITLVLLLLGIVNLVTRYGYTSRSRAALWAVLAASFAISFLYSLRSFPGLAGTYLLLAAAGLTLPVYVALATVVVEFWRKRKQADFDRRVAVLEAKDFGLREAIEHLRAEIQAAAKRQGEVESARQGRGDEARRLRQAVEQWQQGGGAARIRAIKVADWQAEFMALGAADARARRAEQLRTQLHLLQLTMFERELAPESGAATALRDALTDLLRAREARERELLTVRRELQEWRRRRSDFLSKRIVLD